MVAERRGEILGFAVGSLRDSPGDGLVRPYRQAARARAFGRRHRLGPRTRGRVDGRGRYRRGPGRRRRDTALRSIRPRQPHRRTLLAASRVRTGLALLGCHRRERDTVTALTPQRLLRSLCICEVHAFNLGALAQRA